ncbi:hypothetical protein RQM59_12565 [Flavobacteriaceae bacterium S356]|uniref:Uncharacterized protein n=1 Tax=Asprobacillus argus TaxID=3076534 RepID=A0ABU3LHZ7_9FLAO|nr:hypothetical protein [Flavobacteriaceae bacterium S356]
MSFIETIEKSMLSVTIYTEITSETLFPHNNISTALDVTACG